MYVVCNEHLEEAIEEFVEIFEQPPDIYELEKVSFTDWASPPIVVIFVKEYLSI